MPQFLDRRGNHRHKSAVNRQRFLRRFKNELKKAVQKAFKTRSLLDIGSKEEISLPAKDLLEPKFQFDFESDREIILPGNKEYLKGDKIKKATQSPLTPSTSDLDHNAQDEFGFSISEEEFLNIFFEDLELPNLVKKQIGIIPSTKKVQAGFTTEGVPMNINVVRSLKSALSRRIAIGSAKKRQLKRLEKELLEEQEKIAKTDLEDPEQPFRIKQLMNDITTLRKKLNSIPYIDPFDLRYNHRVLSHKPNTKAVMFCLMDVSGSMDETKKDIAKRFFILLYLFLKRRYEKTELVFIRHHTSAKEVNETEFFHSKETGGTVVSSALELMVQIMRKRYLYRDWNIYGAEASDGDNWNNDSPHCKEVVEQQILPFVQYFAYVEIMPRQHQSLWTSYEELLHYPHFAMQHIIDAKDIYPVFRELFKKPAFFSEKSPIRVER